MTNNPDINQQSNEEAAKLNLPATKRSFKQTLSDPQVLASLVFLALVLALGLWRLNRVDFSSRTVPQPATQEQAMPESEPVLSVSPVSYQGEEGKTALELLKAKHQVVTKSFGELGEFVQMIDGRSGDERHFWSFYLNGQPAAVGAGDYRTKAGDVIDWKYEEVK